MTKPPKPNDSDSESDQREATRTRIAHDCVHAVRDIIHHESSIQSPEEIRFIELDIILLLLHAVCQDAKVEMQVREFLLGEKENGRP